MSKTEPLRTAQIGDIAVPRHVAIIMDGNGRWAAARGLPRGEGHRRGVEALRRTVRAAGDLGIDILTIFSFSSENWSRPPAEIRELMTLLRRFIRNDLADLHRSGVQVRDHRRARGSRPGDPQPARGGRDPHARQRQAHPGRRLQLRRPRGDRARRAAHGGRGRGRRSRGRARSPPTSSRAISTRRICPIPISSSAPAASSGCPISCCGRPPTASSCSCRPTGRTSTARRSRARSPNICRRERRFGGLIARTGIVTVAEAEPTRPFGARPAGTGARAAHRVGAGARAAGGRGRLCRRLAVRRSSGASPLRACCGNGRRWSRRTIGATTADGGVGAAGAGGRACAEPTASWLRVIVVAMGTLAVRRAGAGVAAAVDRGRGSLCGRHRARAGRACGPMPSTGSSRSSFFSPSSGRPTSWPISSGARSAVPSSCRASARRRPGRARSAARSRPIVVAIATAKFAGLAGLLAIALVAVVLSIVAQAGDLFEFVAQAAVRREGFRPSHSGPRRADGPARRLRGGGRARRVDRTGCVVASRRPAAVCWCGER